MKQRILWILAGALVLTTSASQQLPRVPVRDVRHHPNPALAHGLSDIQKHMTVMIYIAGNNNLSRFTWEVIEQMARVGSNQQINIVVELHEAKSQETRQRYLIEQGVAYRLSPFRQRTVKLNSGAAETLIDFCVDAIDQFPADHYALIVWGHGSGFVDIDPYVPRVIHQTEFWVINPETMQMENIKDVTHGLAYDDHHQSFLSNDHLVEVLSTVRDHIGRRLDILGFDACLMAMAECAMLVRPYADIMIASQEVGWNAGWSYASMFDRFMQESVTPHQFAYDIVSTYKKLCDPYQQLNNYTLSACDLRRFDGVEQNLFAVSETLVDYISRPYGNAMIELLTDARRNTIFFTYDSYVDLSDLYRNILARLPGLFVSDHDPLALAHLESLLTQGCELIDQVMLNAVSGPRAEQAHGVSIYFPDRFIDESYLKSPFAQKGSWITLLRQLIG